MKSGGYELEDLALPHQLHALCCRGLSTPSVRDRSLALGLALPIVTAPSGGDDLGQAATVIQWHRQAGVGATNTDGLVG